MMYQGRRSERIKLAIKLMAGSSSRMNFLWKF
jgi:hypothetical protein